MPQFDVEGLRFEIRDPGDIDDDTYHQIHDLERDAYQATLRNLRSPLEIDRFVHWKQFGIYRDLKRDPNLAVDLGLIYPNNNFRNAQMVTAYEGDQPVGFVYVADNVSGRNMLVRAAKWHVPEKQYAAFRDIVVHPDLGHHGIGHVLGYLALDQKHDDQTTTAYVYPDDFVNMERSLRKVGFEVTDEGGAAPFDEQERVRMLRMAGLVREIKANLLAMPGAANAIVTAQKVLDLGS